MNVFEELFKDPNFDVLSNLERWNGTRLIKKETVAEHSYLVALFTRIMAENIYGDNYEMVLLALDYALFHDIDEMITGDINHIVKYNDMNGEVIRQALEDYVNHCIERDYKDREDSYSILLKRNVASKEVIPVSVRKLIKIADWLACSFFIYKEICIGNKLLIDSYKRCINKLHEACRIYLAYSDLSYNHEIIKQILTTKFEIQ